VFRAVTIKRFRCSRLTVPDRRRWRWKTGEPPAGWLWLRLDRHDLPGKSSPAGRPGIFGMAIVFVFLVLAAPV